MVATAGKKILMHITKRQTRVHNGPKQYTTISSVCYLQNTQFNICRQIWNASAEPITRHDTDLQTASNK